MKILLIVIAFICSSVFADDINQKNLKTIENFLSAMTTLESEMSMDISSGANISENYIGKIWLDRKNKLLRINYGKSFMIAKNGNLTVCQENEKPQEISTEDTPAGLLLRPLINFNSAGIKVKSLSEIEGLWVLNIVYESPVGLVPVTMYFKPKPVMILMGWTIQNPNGSITNVHLNPDSTHMSIKIPASVFSN